MVFVNIDIHPASVRPRVIIYTLSKRHFASDPLLAAYRVDCHIDTTTSLPHATFLRSITSSTMTSPARNALKLPFNVKQKFRAHFQVKTLVQTPREPHNLGQVWYLIVSIPDLCTLTYLKVKIHTFFQMHLL